MFFKDIQNLRTQYIFKIVSPIKMEHHHA